MKLMPLSHQTDISNKSQLIAFQIVRNENIETQFIFCCELKERNTGEDIFKLVDENAKTRNMKWENCISVCTDGAPAIQGQKRFYCACDELFIV